MITGEETFRLDEDCLGLTWCAAAGYYGCLRWDVLGDTDFVGPYTTITQVRMAVREQFGLWMIALEGSGTDRCSKTPAGNSVARR